MTLIVKGILKFFTHYCLLVFYDGDFISQGGLDVRAQEAALRTSPDIVIATPGRLIDHLRNAPSFNLADIEVLVLDEADRLIL